MDWQWGVGIFVAIAVPVGIAIYNKRSKQPTPRPDNIETGWLNDTGWAWVSYRVQNPAPISWIIETATVAKPGEVLVASFAATTPDPIEGGEPNPTKLDLQSLTSTTRINWPLAPAGVKGPGLIAGTSDQYHSGLWVYLGKRDESALSIFLTFRSTDASQRQITIPLINRLISNVQS